MNTKTLALSITIALLFSLNDCKLLEDDHINIQTLDLFNKTIAKINILTFKKLNIKEEINTIIDIFKLMKTISKSNDKYLIHLLNECLAFSIKIRYNLKKNIIQNLY